MQHSLVQDKEDEHQQQQGIHQEQQQQQDDIESGGVLNRTSSSSSSNSGDDVLLVVNKTDISTGLTTEQVNAAVAKYGTNEIPVKVTPLYVLFLHQFAGFLPFLIEIAAIISLAVQDYVDFGIIAGKKERKKQGRSTTRMRGKI